MQGAVNPDEFYVHKPSLEAGFDAILRRNLGSKAIKMVYSDVASAGQSVETVDVDKQDRRRFSLTDDEVIELAKKEFELLSLLVSKPGKVFSREEIFNKVWGTDVIVGNRTIDVHIRKLREKIGDHYIKTIKGIGYKFEF